MSTATPPKPRPRAVSLPAYLLYGEAGPALAAEWLHIETITARSALHDWEIRPHRHEGLFQILYIHSGQAQAWLDGASHPLVGPCAVLVPPLVAHGFRFQPEVQGHVLTVQAAPLAALLDALLHADPAARLGWQAPRLLMLPRSSAGAPGAADALAAALHTVADEHAAQRPWRGAALDTALRQVLLALSRAGLAEAAASGSGAPGGRALAHVARYRALLEARFRAHPCVADVAAELGITATQLNRVCQSVLGQSALALLHARLALEAQRQLAYTGQSIQRIGLDLGFTDAGYFNRFFLRLCGQTPGQWRRQRLGAERPRSDNAGAPPP
jgi:AraC family transcriptional activator of pobA